MHLFPIHTADPTLHDGLVASCSVGLCELSSRRLRATADGKFEVGACSEYSKTEWA